MFLLRASNKTPTPAACMRSLQLRVLGLLQDVGVEISVFVAILPIDLSMSEVVGYKN